VTIYFWLPRGFWRSYYGYCLCKLLGHGPPVDVPYHSNPDEHYRGCPRCHVNLEG
jgi:hypothetical protein